MARLEIARNLTPDVAATRLSDMPEGQVNRTFSTVAGLLQLSDQELADRSGLKRGSIQAKRAGRAPIKPSDLWSLAGALRIPIECLFMRPSEALAWMVENQPDRIDGIGDAGPDDDGGGRLRPLADVVQWANDSLLAA